jgi:hypothetical protein
VPLPGPESVTVVGELTLTAFPLESCEVTVNAGEHPSAILGPPEIASWEGDPAVIETALEHADVSPVTFAPMYMVPAPAYLTPPKVANPEEEFLGFEFAESVPLATVPQMASV